LPSGLLLGIIVLSISNLYILFPKTFTIIYRDFF
jgi:hypothetical protein